MQDKRPPMKERPTKKALQVNRLRFSAGGVVAAFAEKSLPDRTAEHSR
jgi:hypothetical protein